MHHPMGHRDALNTPDLTFCLRLSVLAFLVAMVEVPISPNSQSLPKKPLAEWCAQYNDGHVFICAQVEHLFTQLWYLGVCREGFRRYGGTIEERTQRMHWMIRAIVHIQQFINYRSLGSPCTRVPPSP